MIMQTFKETYAKANDSINPSDKLVENTRSKMIDPSTEPNAHIFYRGKAFRAAIIIVCCSLLLAGIAIQIFRLSNHKDSGFVFNKIDVLYSGAPSPNSTIRVASITAAETDNYLGYSLEKCLPEPIATFSIDSDGLFDETNLLQGLSLYLAEDLSYGPQRKVIYCEIVNISEKEDTLLIDYMYFDTSIEESDILGTTVVVLERPGYLEVNEATGYKMEIPTVYIAEFTVGTNYYYIEARRGITKTEFIGFVTNLVKNANESAK